MRSRVSRVVMGLALASSLGACGSKDGPAGAASAAASGSAAAAPPASAAAPPKETTAYSVVLESPAGISITPMTGGAFALVSGLLFTLDEGPLVQEPGRMLGVKKGSSLAPLGGTWPKAAWLKGGGGEDAKLYKWFEALGGRWAEQQLLKPDESILSIATIGENTVAAIAMPNTDIRMHLVGGKGGVLPAPQGVKKAPPPAPAPSASASADASGDPAPPADPPPDPPPSDGDGDKPQEIDRSCKVQMAPSSYHFAGSPSGHAFAVGFACEGEGSRGKPLAERWEPKKSRGTIEPLPDGAESFGGITVVSPTEVYAWGRGSGTAYLAKWDGKAWALEKGLDKPIQGFSATSDGTLFAAATSALYTKKGAGAWTKVLLPAAADGFDVTGVWARSVSDVWVTAWKGGKQLLLRSQKVEKTAVMPGSSEVEAQFRTNGRHIATPLCGKPYAHLFSVGPSSMTPPKSFPMVTKAFEGKKFDGAKLVVEDDGANLYVGAKAPTQQMAADIVKAFQDAHPKMKPVVFCHDPKPKSEISWP